jgi:predicted nucleic acid-binding protein
MAAIDTSLLYALFNEADIWHADAKRAIQQNSPVVVPPGVLQETLDLVRLRQGQSAAKAAFAWLSTHPQIRLAASSSDQSHAAALAFLAGSPTAATWKAYSFADVWCVAHARTLGVPLLSRDDAQKRLMQGWSKP